MKKAQIIERGHIMTAEEVRSSATRAQIRGRAKVEAQVEASIAAGEGNPEWLTLLRVKRAEEKKIGE